VTSLRSDNQSASPAAVESVAAQDTGSATSSGPSGQRWRLLAVGLFLAWIALGQLVPLDAVGFLALGALLTAGFQLARAAHPPSSLAGYFIPLGRRRT
jgi:hypothetical protein